MKYERKEYILRGRVTQSYIGYIQSSLYEVMIESNTQNLDKTCLQWIEKQMQLYSVLFNKRFHLGAERVICQSPSSRRGDINPNLHTHIFN